MSPRSILSLIVGVALAAPTAVFAATSSQDLSKECVSPEAVKNLAECPGGPDKFQIKQKRGMAFKSAPPPREVKKRVDDAKPRDAASLNKYAERDTRKTRLKARARALLITEIGG